MSDEQRNEDETEVEGHRNRVDVTEEPADDDESEVSSSFRCSSGHLAPP